MSEQMAALVVPFAAQNLITMINRYGGADAVSSRFSTILTRGLYEAPVPVLESILKKHPPRYQERSVLRLEVSDDVAVLLSERQKELRYALHFNPRDRTAAAVIAFYLDMHYNFPVAQAIGPGALLPAVIDVTFQDVDNRMLTEGRETVYTGVREMGKVTTIRLARPWRMVAQEVSSIEGALARYREIPGGPEAEEGEDLDSTIRSGLAELGELAKEYGR